MSTDPDVITGEEAELMDEVAPVERFLEDDTGAATPVPTTQAPAAEPPQA